MRLHNIYVAYSWFVMPAVVIVVAIGWMYSDRIAYGWRLGYDSSTSINEATIWCAEGCLDLKIRCYKDRLNLARPGFHFDFGTNSEHLAPMPLYLSASLIKYPESGDVLFLGAGPGNVKYRDMLYCELIIPFWVTSVFFALLFAASFRIERRKRKMIKGFDIKAQGT